MDFEFRQATIQDRTKIETFLSIAYAGRDQFKWPFRWEWQFLRNPFLPKAAILPIWIALDKSTQEIIGQNCCLREPLKIGNDVFTASWSVDFFVLPKYRGLGVGTQLHRHNHMDNEIFMSLAMAKGSRRIKQSLGAEALMDVPSFAKKISNKEHCKLSNQIQITQVKRFGPWADVLWNELSLSFPVIIKRNSTFLNWKFVDQPHIQNTVFIAQRHSNICGYIALRKCTPPEPNVGVILDIFVAKKDRLAIHTLCAAAINFFSNFGIDFVIASTTIKEYEECLSDLGFIHWNNSRMMFHANLKNKKISQAFIRENWFLARGDHDWDQFPRARSPEEIFAESS